MGKVYAGARALAILVAIAAAFAAIPYVAVILLVLGAVSAIGNTPEDSTRVFLIAVVLTLGSKALDAIPGVGAGLDVVFSGIGTAAIGASILSIVFGLARRIRSDWVKPASTQPVS